MPEMNIHKNSVSGLFSGTSVISGNDPVLIVSANTSVSFFCITDIIIGAAVSTNVDITGGGSVVIDGIRVSSDPSPQTEVISLNSPISVSSSTGIYATTETDPGGLVSVTIYGYSVS